MSQLPMDVQNRTEYLTKIEEIRQRIQNKQITTRESKLKSYEGQERQNSLKSARIDPLTIAEDLSKRRPLESVENKTNQFQERVKELDSVSERIKTLLATKRNTTQNSNTENTPRTLPGEPALPPKNEKLTSLFQKEIQFSESKVNEGPFTELKSRDLAHNFKEKLHLPPPENCKPNPQLQSQISQIYSEQTDVNSSVKEEPIVAETVPPVFDIEAFRKRFIKEMNRDVPKEKFVECASQPVIPPPIPAQKTEPASTRREQISTRSAPQSTNYPETKKLLDMLSKQIELEGKLRCCKQKFDAFRCQNKIGLLRDELSKRKVAMSEKQLNEWVSIEEEEFDPFVSVVFTREFNFDELISCMCEAKAHWEQRVRGCVQLSELQREEFRIKEVESIRRGVFYLQDLVCLINLKRDSCLRNRDLFSIFKHLMLIESPQIGPEHKIKNETFLQFVSR